MVTEHLCVVPGAGLGPHVGLNTFAFQVESAPDSLGDIAELLILSSFHPLLRNWVHCN